MHQNARFNIIQAAGKSDQWLVIDGQRMPGGYAKLGAKVVSDEMSRDQAIRFADMLQAESDIIKNLPSQHVGSVAVLLEQRRVIAVERGGALDDIMALVTGDMPVHHDAEFLRAGIVRIINECRQHIERRRAEVLGKEDQRAG